MIELFNPIFEAHPEVKGFEWTQYTPYFNDGDTCEFSSNHEYGNVLIEQDGDLVSLEDSDIKYGTSRYKALEEVGNLFSKALDGLNDDDMQALFGDHVKVIVTPDKLDVDEYEHE